MLATFSVIVLSSRIASAEDFTLSIIHTNDVHARIDEFDAKGSRCDDELREKNLCYGGIARQKYMVSRISPELRSYAADNAASRAKDD